MPCAKGPAYIRTECKVSYRAFTWQECHGRTCYWSEIELSRRMLTQWMLLRLIEIDDFIANLWKVHTEVKKDGYAQVRLSSVAVAVSSDMCAGPAIRPVSIRLHGPCRSVRVSAMHQASRIQHYRFVFWRLVEQSVWLAQVSFINRRLPRQRIGHHKGVFAPAKYFCTRSCSGHGKGP